MGTRQLTRREYRLQQEVARLERALAGVTEIAEDRLSELVLLKRGKVRGGAKVRPPDLLTERIRLVSMALELLHRAATTGAVPEPHELEVAQQAGAVLGDLMGEADHACQAYGGIHTTNHDAWRANVAGVNHALWDRVAPLAAVALRRLSERPAGVASESAGEGRDRGAA